MAERIRFHCDEHVDPSIAAALRHHGADVTTTIDAELRTAPDQAHWDYVRSASRVMVTHDADFLRMASETTDHPGVAYCSIGHRTVGALIERLILIYEALDASEIAGRIEFL